MQVIVPSLTKDCIAHWALDAEGIEHDVRICQEDNDYGKLLATLWAFGESFVLVEHDIAPWPGAITRLKQCSSQWCAYQYPLNFELVDSLGCTKFLSELITATWTISIRWAETHWGALDGVVTPRLRTAGYKPHLHSPPVAHVRRYDGSSAHRQHYCNHTSSS